VITLEDSEANEAILPTFTMEDVLVIEGYQRSSEGKPLMTGSLNYPVAQIDFCQKDAVLTLRSVFDLDLEIPPARVLFRYERIAAKTTNQPTTNRAFAIYRKTFLPANKDKFTLELNGSPQLRFANVIRDNQYERTVWHFEHMIKGGEEGIELKVEQAKSGDRYKPLYNAITVNLG
jgi:hypothetical protein